ncbi:MAG: hypothetical protein LBH84_07365 [Prevotellaceae bacterium]|nr:hypothetical protein [Prevotellaceae bacterium]
MRSKAVAGFGLRQDEWAGAYFAEQTKQYRRKALPFADTCSFRQMLFGSF